MFINELISYGIYFELIKREVLGFAIYGNKLNPKIFFNFTYRIHPILSLAIIMSLFRFLK